MDRLTGANSLKLVGSAGMREVQQVRMYDEAAPENFMSVDACHADVLFWQVFEHIRPFRY